jgi:hypothetical protein
MGNLAPAVASGLEVMAAAFPLRHFFEVLDIVRSFMVAMAMK